MKTTRRLTCTLYRFETGLANYLALVISLALGKLIWTCGHCFLLLTQRRRYPRGDTTTREDSALGCFARGCKVLPYTVRVV